MPLSMPWTLFGEEPVPLLPEDQAHLLIEVDGNDLEALMSDCERICGSH